MEKPSMIKKQLVEGLIQIFEHKRESRINRIKIKMANTQIKNLNERLCFHLKQRGIFIVDQQGFIPSINKKLINRASFPLDTRS